MTHSLQIQIEEVAREISKRHEVYARMVDRGKMRRGEAEELIARMQSVLETLRGLEWLREEHEKLNKSRGEFQP